MPKPRSEAPADSTASAPAAPSGAPRATAPPLSAALAAAIFDGSIDGLMIYTPIRDDDGAVVDLRWSAMNPSAAKIAGHVPGEVIGESVLTHMPFEEVRDVIARYAEVLETGTPLTIELNLPRRGGGSGWFDLHCRRFEDEDDYALLVIFRDVTERRADISLLNEIRAEQQTLQRQAMQDPLTGLANRLLLDSRLEHAVSRVNRDDSSVAVMFLDVDRLKVVNDSHGHRIGDLLLAELAHRLTVGVRGYDTIARIGGDEFVVVCVNVADADIPRIARRLLESCTTPFVIEGLYLTVSASVGVTVATDGRRDAATLIADADKAMYVAKQAGGNQIEFHADDTAPAVVDQYVIESILPTALERGEFRLVFDPIVRTNDLRIVAADCRVQWDHPERGRLEHDQVVAAARASKSVDELHRWLITATIEMLARHVGDERIEPVVLAVDVDDECLLVDDFASWLDTTLRDHGVPAELLCIGVASSFLAGDDDASGDVIAALDGLGVLIERTGDVHISPEQYTRYHPIRYVRINPTLVDAIDRGGDTMVRAIVDVGHARGRTMLAGNVTTAAQLDILVGLGIDLVQGSHLIDPLTADQLIQLVRDDPTRRGA